MTLTLTFMPDLSDSVIAGAKCVSRTHLAKRFDCINAIALALYCHTIRCSIREIH